jgi:hypothetical protein
MSEVRLTITLEESDYVVLFNAAVEAKMNAPTFVHELIKTYLEENYGAV